MVKFHKDDSLNVKVRRQVKLYDDEGLKLKV